MSETFRITTLATDRLRAQLDVGSDGADALDGALDDAGYARLDHGMAPAETTAIVPVDVGMGCDPGHRAIAIALTRAMLFIIQADGPPDDGRLAEIADMVTTIAPTDRAGKRLVEVNIGYSRGRDMPKTDVPRSLAEELGTARLAKEVYGITRNQDVVSDVAFERAIDVGLEIGDWEGALWNARPSHEPMMQTRRHDPTEMEMLGVPPPVAELISWVKSHPDVDSKRFESYARSLGLDQQAIASGIERAMRLIAGPDTEPGQA